MPHSTFLVACDKFRHNHIVYDSINFHCCLTYDDFTTRNCLGRIQTMCRAVYCPQLSPLINREVEKSSVFTAIYSIFRSSTELSAWYTFVALLFVKGRNCVTPLSRKSRRTFSRCDAIDVAIPETPGKFQSKEFNSR